jgi:protein-S-isoprenylcysteine O-methyltransferase Ste14
MRRAIAIAGSALFLVIAPGTVAGLVPWWITHWHFESDVVPLLLRIFGGALAAAGLIILLVSFADFAWKGLGTPAPVFPTKTLVVAGFYRYVRNPMYAAVVSLIVGQALIFGSARLLAYGAAVWLLCHLFVLAYEEPVLRATYGHRYELYRASVPRWIPTGRPWKARPSGS